MAGSLEHTKDTLQDALDDLSSPRASFELRNKALQTLERHLALVCLPGDSSEDLHHFIALQYTFECNVPSRLLSWISKSIPTLESLTNKGTMDQPSEAQASMLSSQLSSALSLIQGVSLNHSASKSFLGRKYALEILLDLLLASRHLPSATASSSSSSSQPSKILPLSSAVLDTLLCILVDSPPSLRAFEDVNGIQAIVKILKRAGTPREVRMKCLEFLYFYLLDEAPSSDVPTSPPTAPATPHIRTSSKPFINSKPMRPRSLRYGSSDFSFPSTPSGSSRTASDSSVNSINSTSSSNTSTSTAPSSLSSSPEKPSSVKTPPSSPPLSQRVPQLRSLMMLRKDIDYVPQSPKKVSMLGLSMSEHAPERSISRIQLESGSEDDCRWLGHPTAGGRHDPEEMSSGSRNLDRGVIRTTDEKKELLGTMLGNVDALVEGVRKAGIWGLG